MFALCHFKDDDNRFVLYDKKDLTEVANQLNIEIENKFSFNEFDKDYSLYPLLDVNDLIIRSLNRKARTGTHILDELGLSCWMAIKNEYQKIQEKKSKFSRSQRELVVTTYNYICSIQD